jgi:NADPH:quinone reductase-like Zn-dependent oxidoreductase
MRVSPGQNATSMRAMLLERFGPPETMRLTDVPIPTIGPDDVLIKVAAVSVNRTLDLIVRAGEYARPVRLPHVLGADPSGVIVEVGANVIGPRVGDRVATSPKIRRSADPTKPVLLGVDVWGGYADYVAVPAANTHLIPAAMDFVTATVIARHAPLAINMLRTQSGARSGETVLIMGASGGLGSAAIQVAKHLGLTVIAAAGTEAGLDLTRRLGADHTVNYRETNLREQILSLTGRGVDIVLENVGTAELFPLAIAAMAHNGRLVTAGAHGGGKVTLDVNTLYLKHLTIIGSTVQSDEDVARSFELAERGVLTTAIDRVMPLDRAVEAHQLVAERANHGKVVLIPGELR